MSKKIQANFQRIHYEKPTYYSNRVLVGPWVESRAKSVKENYKHSTTYNDHFPMKPPSKIDPAIMWDLKLNEEDSNFISQIETSDFPNYFKNFSSTYDLSYNHFPKCFESYIPRTLRFRLGRYEPNDDYIPSYGNITNYGLLGYYQEKWSCEAPDPRVTCTTVYNDTYTKPNLEDYTFKRRAIPKTNSSILNNNNLQSIALKLRNKPMCNVPEADVITTQPTTKRCNPITWECPTSDDLCLHKTK